MKRKILLLIGIVLTVAKGIMDFLGHIDFIVERYHDPNWLGVVYNYIMSFSPTMNLMIMLVALSLYWYSSKTSPHKDTAIKSEITQSENAYIESLIKEIRSDVYLYRGFKDLMSREDGKHPAIISNWRAIASGQLLYLGDNSNPTDEELHERKAISWLISKGIAEPEGDNSEKEHWYFLSKFGWKVKWRYQELYER